jgi:RND superfamily putative drug exporter
MTVASVPPMRSFATWCTGHRKTVIIGWILALIVVGMAAGSAGSKFTEEFKLPASDSQEAFDLLETKFPAQSGDTALIVFKAPGGVESAAVEKKMEDVFAEVGKFPHVSEIASPTRKGAPPRSATTARSPTRRSSSTSPTTSSTKTATSG